MTFLHNSLLNNLHNFSSWLFIIAFYHSFLSKLSIKQSSCFSSCSSLCFSLYFSWKVLSLIFSSECQWHHRVIHISDSLIQFTHHRRWSKANNQTSKSRQSIRRFKYFKQSASSESCRTDFSTDEFIQRMCNT